MNDLEMWSLLVGSLMPTLVAVIQQPRFSNAQRALVGVGASLVAGFMTTWVAQDDAPFVESKTTVLKSG